MVILPLQQCQITIRSDNVLIILCLFVILLFAITVTILAVTTRPIVLLINLVRCTFHLVLLKRHLKTIFHFILFSIRILFICILFIRLLFSSYTFYSYNFDSYPFCRSYTFRQYTFHSYIFICILLGSSLRLLYQQSQIPIK